MVAKTVNPDAILLAMSEKEVDKQVQALAKLFGWSLSYHTWTSIHSAPGFPDRVYLRPPRILFLEEKRERGVVTGPQQVWADALSACPGVEYMLVRPSGLAALAERMR